jgi:very-short-patch-repair endonuclease
MMHPKIITKGKQNLGASANIKNRARELRKNLTSSETKLWGYLRKRQLEGKHFRKQHPYGIYILDFYCFEAGLAIEIDGPIHLRKHEYDLERKKYIESTGVKVLRFINDDIENRIEWVLKKIKLSINKRHSPECEG